MPRTDHGESLSEARTRRRPRRNGGHDAAIASETPEHDPKSLAELNELITAEKPFVKGGTHAVLGEGPVGAALAFVGEQPGDQEDLAGHPFVGPAGRLLDHALNDAGIDRLDTYVTNAVKHFKYVERGKRRIHQKPTRGEVRHYRWWLMKELELVHPHLVVALGATAAMALTGRHVVIADARGLAHFDGFEGLITVHPSSLLRIADRKARAAAYAALVRDLRKAKKLSTSQRGGPQSGRSIQGTRRA